MNAQKGKNAKAKAVAVAPAPGKNARPRGASALWGTVDFPLKRRDSPHGQVTAVSMMKDEGPFLIEWVAHHLATGFTDLVVYTNDCSDGTDDMLIRLEELGLAHHRRNLIPEGLRPQPSALNHAQVEPVVCQSDWVMVFDADEFLSIRCGNGTLDDLLFAARQEGANGIVITWRIFGSGGVVDWSRAPVTEQYLMAAPTGWNKGWGVKTLFSFDAGHWKLGIHRPKMKTKWIKTDFPDQVKWLNGSGQPMEDYFKFRGWRSITRTVGHDWVQLNHYAVKSVDSYAIRKLRGNVNFKKDKYNADYWALQDRNEVRDDTMLRYTAARDDLIAQLLQDPVLHRLHHAAIERAEARLAEIKATEAYQALKDDLARASAVPITQIVAKPPQARDREKVAAKMSDIEKARADKDKAERKGQGSKAQSGQIPAGLYRTGLIDLADPREVEVFANQSMKLPADDRVFAAPALPLIRAGKFERGLSRRLPLLPAKGARVLELGAAVGFLAGHLANSRPDLNVALQEDDPGLRQMMALVCKLSWRDFNDRFRLLSDQLGDDPLPRILKLIAAERPDLLLLADPRLPLPVLTALFAALPALPGEVAIHGRLIEAHHADLPAIAAMFARHGYQPAGDFDPDRCRYFQRGAAGGQE